MPLPEKQNGCASRASLERLRQFPVTGNTRRELHPRASVHVPVVVAHYSGTAWTLGTCRYSFFRSRSCTDGTRSAAAISPAICVRRLLPCHFSRVYHRPGDLHCLSRSPGLQDRQPAVDAVVALLDPGICGGLCHGGGVRHRDVV